MIEKVAETMTSIEGEALRAYTLVKIDEVKDGNWSFGEKSSPPVTSVACSKRKSKQPNRVRAN